MPLYEYACLECDERFEELRPAARADAALPCNTCGSTRVKRLLSVFAARPTGAVSAIAPSGGGCACGGNCSCRN